MAGSADLVAAGGVRLQPQEADALALDQRQHRVGHPVVGPAVGALGVNRLRLDADQGAVLGTFAPQALADWRAPVGVVVRHDRVELEVAVVHAARDDDLVLAALLLGADPAHVGALAVHDLGRRLGGHQADELAVLGGQRLEQAVEHGGLGVAHRDAEGGFSASECRLGLKRRRRWRIILQEC